MSALNRTSVVTLCLLPKYIRLSGCPQSLATRLRSDSKSVVVPEEENDPMKPVQFSTSGAASWKGTETVRAERSKLGPWYKDAIIWGCIFVFYIYFGFLREENDIDEELKMPLGKRLLTLEAYRLQLEKNALHQQKRTTYGVDEELDKIHELMVKYKYVD